MIILFVGTVGSGKTLSMTYQAYQYWQQGFTVFTNYKLAFPHVLLTKKKFNELIEDKTQLQNAVILLDELHIWLDSRSAMKKKNKAITYFILQTRKRNVRLLATTQHFHQVDKRFRDTVDILVSCSNVSDKSSVINDSGAPVVIQQESIYQYSSAPPKVKMLRANPIFGLYDTSEMVDFTDDD